jgi:PIN domain nuclease of toxin-antitoxin system
MRPPSARCSGLTFRQPTPLVAPAARPLLSSHAGNLSLADRVCLALARSLSSPAYATDREEDWADALGVTVVVIR